MAKTIEELKTQSEQIKNASVVGENTATRVGTLFGDVVDTVNEEINRAKAAEEANATSIIDNDRLADGAVTYKKTDIIKQELGENENAVVSQKTVTNAVGEIKSHIGDTYIKQYNLSGYHDKTFLINVQNGQEYIISVSHEGESGEVYILQLNGDNEEIASTLIDSSDKKISVIENSEKFAVRQSPQVKNPVINIRLANSISSVNSELQNYKINVENKFADTLTKVYSNEKNIGLVERTAHVEVGGLDKYIIENLQVQGDVKINIVKNETGGQINVKYNTAKSSAYIYEEIIDEKVLTDVNELNVYCLGARVVKEGDIIINVTCGNALEISNLEKHKANKGTITLIGDSISTFLGTMPQGYKSTYPAKGVNSVEDTYWGMFAKKFDMEVQNLSYSGSRATSSDIPSLFDRALLANASDLYIIALGTNDWSNGISLGSVDYESDISSLDNTTFMSAYVKGIKQLMLTNPKAKFLFISLGMVRDYANAIKVISEYFNAMYFDASELYDYNSDVHPNKADFEIIGKALIEYYSNETSTTKDCIFEEIPDEEFVEATVDANEKFIYGVRKDGSFSLQSADLKSTISEEFIDLTIDANEKVIKGIKPDGTCYFNKISSPTLIYEKQNNDRRFKETNSLLSDNNIKAIEEVKKIKLALWNEMQFGMFIHWGIYSAWGGTYTGKDITGQDITYNDREWILYNGKLDRSTYMSKQSEFTSEGWNPEKICKLAMSVGMKYIILTIRHHEGFSLIPSSHCDWDVSSSGADVDIVMKLKKACDRHGLKFCIYYSYFVNWTEYGGYRHDAWNNGEDPFIESEHAEYVEKQKAYINEIVDKLEPFIVWYDPGIVNSSDTLQKEFAANETKNYPYILFNDRGCGNKDFYESEFGDPDEPSTNKNIERCSGLQLWGYSSLYDNDISNYPSFGEQMWSFIETFSRGFNYLLNIGPKGDGSLPEPIYTWFGWLSSWTRKYTFFNGCKRLAYYGLPSWGRILYKPKENAMYLVIFPDNQVIYLDSLDTSNIKRVYIYGAENPESTDNYSIVADDRLEIRNIPTNQNINEYFSVVRIELFADACYNDYIYTSGNIPARSLVREKSESHNSGVKFTGKYICGKGNNILSTRFLWNGITGEHGITINGTISGQYYELYDEFDNIISNGSSVSLVSGKIYKLLIKCTTDSDKVIEGLIIK